MMHGRGKSDPGIVAVKPANNAEQIRCGVGGAKGGDQGKCGSAKHAPGSGPGKCVTGAGTHTASVRRQVPEVGAGCIKVHVRIRAGGAG
jgi:hypothetical protein